MSPYKRLFVLVEGDDDERFFTKVLSPIFEQRYDRVEQPIRYAQMTKKAVVNFIKSIKSMQADYIFFADINSAPCVGSKKQKLSKMYKHLDRDRIIIVIREIESWYLAGLDEKACQELKIKSKKHCINTDDLTKEQFYGLNPTKSDKMFLLEVLNRFSIEMAKNQNKSFKYFTNKYGI